jgi:hypothetical protein
MENYSDLLIKSSTAVIHRALAYIIIFLVCKISDTGILKARSSQRWKKTSTFLYYVIDLLHCSRRKTA